MPVLIPPPKPSGRAKMTRHNPPNLLRMGDGVADAPKLQQGSIVWISHAPDRHGRNPKPQSRAFVILNSTDDIRAGAILVGVAVTGTFSEPVPETHVPMRWNAAGSTETGFRRKCFAVVDWTHRIPLAASTSGEIAFDGEFEGKRIRQQELLKILEARAKVATSSTSAKRGKGSPRRG